MSKYGVFLVYIQSKYGKIRTRKTVYLDTFHAVNTFMNSLKIVTVSEHLLFQTADHPIRSSHLEVYFRKEVLKTCSKFTGEHPCPSAILIKLQRNFIEITLWHGWPSVNLLHIFRTPFLRNKSERLVLSIAISCS